MKQISFSKLVDGDRWDARFYDSEVIDKENEMVELGWITVGDIAKLIRRSPDFGEETFQYIDIDAVDKRTGFCLAKEIQIDDKPSRAKRGVKADDVLVSLVRPNKGCVMYVGEELDGAVATSGFGVIRGNSQLESAWVFSCLLTEFSGKQMMRRAKSTMYPTLAPDDILKIVIPPFNESEANLVFNAIQKLNSLQIEAKNLRSSLIREYGQSTHE